jgi:hypothetical protein
MTDPKRTWREAQADARQAEQDARWGMQFSADPDPRSPVEIARQSYERGDRLLHLDVPVSWVQGATGIGVAATRAVRPERTDVLGAVEAEGWRLEHASSTFVHTGDSANGASVGSSGQVAYAAHGIVLGVYVFRRDETARVR